MELLIGCGSQRVKRLCLPGRSGWDELVTLDSEGRHQPDIVHDLNERPLPFLSDIIGEIHAYHVLEHVGSQGDWRGFFAEWAEYWRILKPGGTFHGICPMWNSPWAWGDPSHTRIVGRECVTFLDQREYTEQVGKTAMADYRSIYKADFEPLHLEEKGEEFLFILRAVKPSRISV